MEEEVVVVIVGAGPSGLATSACLTLFSIPNIILEREDCSSSLWKKRTYDRLKLHLAKKFCYLPYMPHPSTTPTFISKKAFIKYMDDYVSNFKLSPNYFRSVESATYGDVTKRWHIEAKNTASNQKEVYVAEFLVVATGENSEGYIPRLPGLSSFRGEVIHSSEYKSGWKYHNKEVMVVGCGNSGMEIAFDLASHGAHTSIVVRSPVSSLSLSLSLVSKLGVPPACMHYFHVLNKEMVYLGMFLLKYLPISAVDPLIIFLANLMYGNLTKYGISRPEKGPFYLKATTGRSPVIDVGTVEKIKMGHIQVFPAISSIKENDVTFDNGKMHQYDAILFATGYKSTANNWLKDYSYCLNNDGMPKNTFPNHWKGQNGLYCAGMSKRGLFGVSMDAKAIASDIQMVINGKEKKPK
ncbi:hypothetical protein HHK36_004249 [Tetracentron sinense]|uniref:Flavin-containing monooxygenase n=1 Tax=Tetracentron sinense TaxID=13715 RepID=A0A835DQ41_TETSI|nr:hypothetical protein HHK36_004249 [Tetracentron sinense]